MPWKNGIVGRMHITSHTGLAVALGDFLVAIAFGDFTAALGDFLVAIAFEDFTAAIGDILVAIASGDFTAALGDFPVALPLAFGDFTPLQLDSNDST